MASASESEYSSDMTFNRLLDCMRTIVAILASERDGHAPRPPKNAEQILVDVDLNGRRYLLIEMPLHDHRMIPLSPRELEIVRMVAEGRPNKIIAGVLDISSWTVAAHLRRIFAKLGVTSRAAMVARSAELGGVVGWNKRVELPSTARATVAGPASCLVDDRPRPQDLKSKAVQGNSRVASIPATPAALRSDSPTTGAADLDPLSRAKRWSRMTV